MTKYIGNLCLSSPPSRLSFARLPRLCGSSGSSLLLIGTAHWPETVAAGALRRSAIFGAEGYFRLISLGAVATHLRCSEESVLMYSVPRL